MEMMTKTMIMKRKITGLLTNNEMNDNIEDNDDKSGGDDKDRITQEKEYSNTNQ